MTAFTRWLNAEADTTPERLAYWNSYDIARQKVVVYGGAPGGTTTMEWSTDTCAWIEIETDGIPDVEHGANRMAYDRVRAEHLLFGGVDGGGDVQNGTWVYDGATGAWTAKAPSNVPNNRYSYALEYDPVRGVSVMFGGWNATFSDVFGDTCIWDGSEWTISTPGISPGKDADIFLAWDPFNNELILLTVGAFAGGPGYATYGETWAWNGAWTQKFPSNTPPLAGHRFKPMGSTDGQGIYLLSYDDSFPAAFTIWHWTGDDWLDVTPSSPGDNLPETATYVYGPVAAPCDQMLVLIPTDAVPANGYLETWTWTECPCLDVLPRLHRVFGMTISLLDNGVEGPVSIRTSAESQQASS